MSVQFQCKKSIGCAGSVYSFALELKAYPDHDSLRIGDTIWLEVDAPTSLTDLQTGREIDYSGAANLGSAISFQALSRETGQFTIDAVEKFNFLLVQRIEVENRSPNLYKGYNFAEVNGRYVFKLGLVPKEQGTFGLIFSNADNVYRKTDNCTKASFGLTFKNTNQHYYLNPNFQGGPTPVGGDYYFKVY